MTLVAHKFYWIHDDSTGWTYGRSVVFCGVLHDLTGLRLHGEHAVSVVHYVVPNPLRSAAWYPATPPEYQETLGSV